MSLRDWTWSYATGPCDARGSKHDGANGTWSSPQGVRGKRLCWTHYQEALRQEAAVDAGAVLAERERIAAGLEAWAAMWAKPNPVASTNKKVRSSGTVSLDWLREFAEKIRDGTFGKPHNPEPDPLYEVSE